MSRKFVPDHVNLPTVPGSPSTAEEETMEDIETEDTNPNMENFNSEHEVFVEPHSDDKQEFIPVPRSNFFTNPILEAPRPAVTVNVVSGSLKGRSRKDTKSDSSSKSQSHKSSTSSLSRVMTPGNVSRESGYITSTQRTEIGIISPSRTGSYRSETGVRVTHRQTSMETPGSVATTSSQRYRELPQVFFNANSRRKSSAEGREVTASTASSRSVVNSGTVQTAHENLEDSEDFVFTDSCTASDQNSEGKRVQIATPSGGTKNFSPSKSSHSQAVSSGPTGKRSYDTLSSVESLKSPLKVSSKRSSVIAEEQQNQLEESLLLDLSTLGSSPRNRVGGSSAQMYNNSMPAAPSLYPGATHSSDSSSLLAPQIRIHLTHQDNRGQLDSRSIHPSSWGRTPVSFPSMPTSRTTNSSGSGSSFSSYSPSFSHQYSSPEKTNNHRDRERFPSDIRTMTYSSYTEVPCSTCDNESFSRSYEEFMQTEHITGDGTQRNYMSLFTGTEIPLLTRSGETTTTRPFSFGQQLHPDLLRHTASNLSDTIAANFGRLQKIPPVVRTAMSAQEVKSKGSRFGSSSTSSSSKRAETANEDTPGDSASADDTGTAKKTCEVVQSLVDDIESEDVNGEEEDFEEELEGGEEEEEAAELGEEEGRASEGTQLGGASTQESVKFSRTGYTVPTSSQDQQSTNSKTSLRERVAKSAATKSSVSWKPSIKTYSSNSMKDTELSFEEFICTAGSVCDCTQTDESGLTRSSKNKSQASQSEDLLIDDLEEDANDGGMQTLGSSGGVMRSTTKRSKTPSRSTGPTRSVVKSLKSGGSGMNSKQPSLSKKSFDFSKKSGSKSEQISEKSRSDSFNQTSSTGPKYGEGLSGASSEMKGSQSLSGSGGSLAKSETLTGENLRGSSVRVDTVVQTSGDSVTGSSKRRTPSRSTTQSFTSPASGNKIKSVKSVSQSKKSSGSRAVMPEPTQSVAAYPKSLSSSGPKLGSKMIAPKASSVGGAYNRNQTGVGTNVSIKAPTAPGGMAGSSAESVRSMSPASFTAEIKLDLKVDFGKDGAIIQAQPIAAAPPQNSADVQSSTAGSGSTYVRSRVPDTPSLKSSTRSTGSKKLTSTQSSGTGTSGSVVNSGLGGDAVEDGSLQSEKETTGELSEINETSETGGELLMDEVEDEAPDESGASDGTSCEDLTQAMIELCAQDRTQIAAQMRIDRYIRNESHFHDDRELIERLMLHSEDRLSRFAFDYRDQYFANTNRLMSHCHASERFLKHWNQTEKALYKLFRHNKDKPRIPYRQENCYDENKRRVNLPFYGGVAAKESFSLVANLQNSLALLNQSLNQKQTSLVKTNLQNALRQLVGKKMQRPSPMEILIVMERQKLRFELIHRDLCNNISKTTDALIQNVLLKQEKEVWRFIELKHQEIMTLCNFIAENEDEVWKKSKDQNQHYLSHIEVEPFYRNKSEFLQHLKHVSRNMHDRMGRPDDRT